MATDRYGLYSASFTHAGGTLDLQQLDSQSTSAGSGKKLIRPGGALAPAAHILSTANPRMRFTTCDVLTVLTAMGGEFHLACSGGHVGRFQQRLPGGAFASGSSHYFQSSAKGFLHVVSIDVDIDSDEGASMVLEYIPLSTDGTNPITEATGQSLSGVAAPSFMSQFYQGGVWAGSSQIPSLTRASYAPGVRFTTRRADSGVWPLYGASSITAYEPMINLSFLNAGLPATIGTFFLSALGSAIKGYLQRGTTATDGRIAAATTSHIKVAAATGSWGADDLSVSGENDATVNVMIHPTAKLVPTLSVALGG